MQNAFKEGTRLHDDPLQQQPIRDPQAEERMVRHMVKLMQENDTPRDQYLRLALPV